MRIEVVRLRHLGQKLAKEDLPPAVAGVLIVDTWTLRPPGGVARKVKSANLHHTDTPNSPQVIPGLHDVELKSADGRGMLLVGEESIDHTRYRQAWWCRPVSPAG